MRQDPIAQLDDVARGGDIARRIREKPSLRLFYERVYQRYQRTIQACPREGAAIELGAGVGFAGERVEGLITADLLPYPGLDLVFDAAALPFADRSLRFVGMLNVLHHLPDVPRFLEEASRCLVPGGRMLVVDHYPGLIGHAVLRFGHHEPYRPQAEDWRFETTGPLSGANAALAWIVFLRDRERFEARYPDLRVTAIRRHSPTFYWLTGGLKRWTLLPAPLHRPVWWLDDRIGRLAPGLASFMDVEIQKVG